MGTTTHLLWVINNGFLSEKYSVPVLSKFFWDSLTFLDPVAAILLLLKPKTGIWVAVIIIIIDVLHNGNNCFRALLKEPLSVTSWIINNWMLWAQFFFGLFIIVSFKNNWRELKFKSIHSCFCVKDRSEKPTV